MQANSPKVEKFARFVLRSGKFSIILSLILTLGLSVGLKDFAEKNDVRIWFMDDDPNIEVLNKFEKQFGNDESIVVAIHSPSGIFDVESATLLRKFNDKMWYIPEVIRVDSLANYNFSYAEEDDILIEPFFDEDVSVYDAEYLEKRKKIALSHEVMPGYLVSRDAKSVLLFARLVTTPKGSPNYQKIVEATHALVNEFKGSGDHQFHILGEAAVNDAFRSVANDDSAVIIPLLFLLLVVFLYYVFRNVKAVIYPLIVIGLSATGTLGFGFFLGIKFNSVLSILPGILIAIGIADSVHVVSSYFQFRAKGEDNYGAALSALKKNLVPTLLTSVSTTIGFFSLMSTSLLPIRQLGLLAGVGSLLAWVVTIFLVAPILATSNFKIPQIFFNSENPDENPISSALVKFLHKRSGTVLVSFIIIFLCAGYIGSKNEVNSNPYSFFTKEIPLRQADDFVKESFGGNFGPELVIESGKQDGVKDPEFLKKVEALKAWIDAKPFVNKTVDIIDIIKDMNRSFNEGKDEYYKLPDSQNAIAEMLLMYTMSLPQGMDLNNRMTLNFDAMRMSVVWGVTDTRGWLRESDKIINKAKELGLNVHVTGKFHLFQAMLDYLVWTFFVSITTAFILVAIMLSILFKSIKLGLISLIPNIVPLVLGSAFMKLAGMDLNIGTALVASVCLGIAVDDTIHFLSNYYKYIKSGLSETQAIQEIFKYTGMSLVITTMILAACFALFVLGHFVPNVNFGMLCAFILTIALIVDLIFLPALMFTMNGAKKPR